MICNRNFSVRESVLFSVGIKYNIYINVYKIYSFLNLNYYILKTIIQIV